MWRANRSLTSNELRDDWKRYVQGWWGYFRLAEARRPVFRLEGWIRRHIRKCFWHRWHSAVGRERALRRLGLRGRMLKSRIQFAGRVAAGCAMAASRPPCRMRPFGDMAF